MYYPDPRAVSLETETSGWTVFGRPTNEELVGAHLSGIEIGMQEHEKIIQDQHLNLKKSAIKISEEIYSRLKDKFKIKPLGMRMRTQGFSSFGTLFLLQADDFYSDKIEEIYTFLNEERKKVTHISWSFVLMPVSKELNESAISSDGYTLSYAERS
jgi:hypothetical protein